MTPSARSTKYLRDRGWIVARVEQRLHMPKSPFPITKDAFNFGDLLAAKSPGEKYVDLSDLNVTITFYKDPPQIALVQVTSGSHHDHRKDKIAAEPLAQKWKDAGGVILLHSWSKKGSRGKRKTWTLREEVL
jgi:hypothetical protein